VIRGGTGLFFGTQGGNQAVDAQLFGGQRILVASFISDGNLASWPSTRGITANDVISGKVLTLPPDHLGHRHDSRCPPRGKACSGSKQLNDVTGFDAPTWSTTRHERGRNVIEDVF
jgi:hypothetical protein